MGKVKYSGTATGGADALISANAARTSFWFSAVGGDFTLTFSHKGVSYPVTVKQGQVFDLTNTHREPLDCRDAATVTGTASAAFDCYAEEG